MLNQGGVITLKHSFTSSTWFSLLASITLLSSPTCIALTPLIPAITVHADEQYQDGEYEVTGAFKKADDPTQDSVAQNFFAQQVKVQVKDNQLQLILHMDNGADYLKQIQVEGNDKPTNIQKNGQQADITVSLPNNSGKYSVDMQLDTPMGEMNQKANLLLDLSKLKKHSTNDKPTQPATNNNQTPTDTPKNNDSNSRTNTEHQDSTPVKQPQQPTKSSTDNDEYSLKIVKASNPQEESAAQKFFSSHVSINPLGNDYLLTFHLTNGSNFIKEMKFNNQSPDKISRNGEQVSYSYRVSSDVIKAGQGKLNFALSTPMGNMNEEAIALFTTPQHPTTITTPPAISTTPSVTSTPAVTGQHAIDPNKVIQDVKYTVLNSQRSGNSEANNYYTHTAHVVKTGNNGYDVTLTVSVKHGLVSFTPLRMAAGPITGVSAAQSNGLDEWHYTFHINDYTALDNPVAGSIRISVPIANINNQTFNVWFIFGKTSTGGPNALAAMNGGTGDNILANSDPANSNAINSPIGSNPGNGSLVQTALNTVPPTNHPFDLKAAKKQLAKYQVNPTLKHLVHNSQVDYPILAALLGFIGTAFIIIGGASIWHHQLIKKVRGNYHEDK